MDRRLESDVNAKVTRDDDGTVRSILVDRDRPKPIAGVEPDGPAPVTGKSHIRRMAGQLGIDLAELGELDRRANYLEPDRSGPSFHVADQKTFFDTTTHLYVQTWLGTPVWQAGITATVRNTDGAILSLANTRVGNVDAQLPAARNLNRFRRLFAVGEKGPGAEEGRTKATTTSATKLLTEILGPALDDDHTNDQATPELISGRFYVYRLDIANRQQDRYEREPVSEEDTPVEHDHRPTLPIAPLPNDMKDGSWYLVAELIVRLRYDGHRMNWRLLVDVESNAVLYVRALTANVNGLVYTYDPITSTGDNTNTAASSSAVLNPLRDDVVLQGLDPAVGGTQSLTGEYVTVINVEDPDIDPPTRPVSTDFDYDARSDEFSAVNAYYQNDRFFRLVEDLGFTISDYFDGTSFPIDVDHRGLGSANNAHCPGDGDGIGHACYGLIDTSDGNPMGNACEWSVVLHELGGHGILHDHVDGPNLGFSHSIGDSFAIILNDFASGWHNGGAIDRFVRSPFRMNFRRSDRDPANGWGWGGTQDDGNRGTEQMLSTIHFRVYRSIGGDSVDLSRREFSANLMSYLMLRAVATLTPATNPGGPEPFLDALLTADNGDWTTHGVSGGAYAKVLEWSFEKQDLNDGNPPPVDVYIDDGRGGEYEYLADHRATATIWNRHSPDDVGAHQDPVIGTNYAYVRIRNRGTSTANQVTVRGFHCKPLAGHIWPVDFAAMDTAEIGAPTIGPNDADEVVIGPFEWVPNPNEDGDDSMMMVVSAEGDADHADKYHAGRMIEDWRLVPNDNNIAIRTVQLRPRLVTVLPDDGAFGQVCVGDEETMMLTISNSGFNTLSITNIISNSVEFEPPGVDTYPIVIGSGDSIDVPLRFQPSSVGDKVAQITVLSNAPGGPRILTVSGRAPAPRLVTVIADDGDFGRTCLGDLTDRMLTLSNSGRCPLTIHGIASTSADFVAPGVDAFPIVIGAGDSLQVPIRFQPTNFGPATGTITIASDDPEGPKSICVEGTAPPGRLSITGSTCIGGVKACCVGERMLTLANTGPCPLRVSHVGLARPSQYWKLVNNPFPATLQPGGRLDVLIRYKAEEKCPRAQGLVIETDDPDRPEVTLDLLAYTVWQQPTGKGSSSCGCNQCGCGGNQSGSGQSCGQCCDQGCTPQSIDACCFDEECEESH